MPDLWPGNFHAASITPPVAILKEQATLLGQKTSHVLEGEVVANKSVQYSTDDFGYTFHIVAPTLDYHYRLLSISYPIIMYPVGVYADVDIMREQFDASKSISSVRAKDEADFLEILRKIFSATKTSRIISALLTQAGTS